MSKDSSAVWLNTARGKKLQTLKRLPLHFWHTLPVPLHQHPPSGDAFPAGPLAYLAKVVLSPCHICQWSFFKVHVLINRKDEVICPQMPYPWNACLLTNKLWTLGCRNHITCQHTSHGTLLFPSVAAGNETRFTVGESTFLRMCLVTKVYEILSLRFSKSRGNGTSMPSLLPASIQQLWRTKTSECKATVFSSRVDGRQRWRRQYTECKQCTDVVKYVTLGCNKYQITENEWVQLSEHTYSIFKSKIQVFIF